MKIKKIVPAVILLAAAVVLIITGVAREEQLDVMRKAVNICLECIGIG